MTHDELLSRIKYKVESCNRQDIDSTGWSALRAVVELHKPFQVPEKVQQEDTLFVSGLACYLCSTEMYIPYPCPTVWTIEEQLQ